jgi:hypothetical protein
MDGTLLILDMSPVKVVTQVVSERPNDTYVNVGVMQSVKFLTGNPMIFVGVFAVNGVNEHLS